jgi:hypothetical protein
MTYANELLGRIVEGIVNPIILLLFAVALVVFLWGMVLFVAKGDNEEARKTGGRHILYGIIGMAIMISAFGIMKLIVGSIGASDEPIRAIER